MMKVAYLLAPSHIQDVLKSANLLHKRGLDASQSHTTVTATQITDQSLFSIPTKSTFLHSSDKKRERAYFAFNYLRFYLSLELGLKCDEHNKNALQTIS